MRIFLFPKYIKEKELQSCVLKNCSVVIDGQNFLHEMYEESKLRFVFGCESDKYAEYLRNRLNMFKEANVKCFFVLKGGDSNVEKKIKKNENADGDKFDFIENNKFVAPVLMKEVYKQVLDKMGIPYVVCEFECKRDCAALAERLSCPVISNDIEFCFLNAPYIPHQTLRYNHKMKSIDCKQYKRNNFLNKHSLTERKLAIFSVLADTNVFPDGYFNDLLKSWGAIRKDVFMRYITMWQWLSKREESAALGVICNRYRGDKEKIERAFNSVLDFMQPKQQSIAADYLLNGGKLHFEQNDSMWFQKGVVSKHIAIPYIDLYSNKYLIGKRAIESKNSKFSLLLSMDIVKYAYNLLTDFKRDEFKYVIGSEEVRIQAKRAPGAIQTPAFANGWSDVKKMGLFENFLKENSINEALIAQAPSDAAMLLIALVYFARKKSSDNVSVEREVYSVITCFAMMAGSGDIAADDRAAAGEATRGYFEVSTGEMMRIFDRESLHSFVELQQCLQQLNYLNVLCGSPYEPTVYHRAYNGTFVYKLFRDMVDSDRDCATFVNNLFNCSTSVLCYINKLIGLYKQLL